MEAVVFKAIGGKLLEVGGVTWPTKGTGRTETHVVNQDDQHIGRTRWRAQIADRRIGRIWVFGVVGGQADVGLIGDGQNGALDLVL